MISFSKHQAGSLVEPAMRTQGCTEATGNPHGLLRNRLVVGIRQAQTDQLPLRTGRL